jgi:hypothetical protein
MTVGILAILLGLGGEAYGWLAWREPRKYCGWLETL